MNGLTNIISILKNENTVLSHKVKVLADENDILRKKLGMVNNKKFTNNKISSPFIDNDKNHINNFIDNFIDRDSENSEERDFFITLREVKAEMEDKKNKNKKNKNKKSQNK